MKTYRRGPRLLNYPLQRNVAPITAYRLFADPTQCERLWPSGRCIDNLEISSSSAETTIPGHIMPQKSFCKPLQGAAGVVLDLQYPAFAVAKLYQRVTVQAPPNCLV
jgi:hypothetical protein